MHLDRIEISGFKSFADKTIIEFDKGVTAVVGPNGSGKSNLSEAIKWVLGEQSAKSLRGKKMDDIIFAGSQTRKPTNVAEVTLVLNNEDGFLPLEFPEIQITRRFNRNGDSDCFINKKPCRLKDIVTLLMDSGLGKDSFSIISQGKVETIFHNKPEERRAMFEEVAGVLKYKTRKLEASRKLDKTQEHLDRVEDILFEISGQLEPLKIQREKALTYTAKKQELGHIDIALMVAEITTLNQQWDIAKQELKTLQQAIETKEKNVLEKQDTIDALKTTWHQIDEQLNRTQQKFVALVQETEQVLGQYHVLKERSEFSSKGISQQDSALFDKKELITSLENELDALKQTLADKQEGLVPLQQLVEELRQEHELLSDDSKEHLEQERELYINTLQQQTDVKNQLTYAKKEQASLTAQEQQLLTQKETLTGELERVVIQVEDASQHYDNVKTKLADLMTEYQSVADALQKQQQEYDEYVLSYQNKQQELSRLDARRVSIQEMSEDYSGFYQGVKEILKQKQQLKGIHGAIAELIQVPSQYTTAIDIALGASMQHIVVTDDRSARDAIDYLKTNRLGRATFLPISAMKKRVLTGEVLSVAKTLEGFLGVASELVQTHSDYEAIVAHFLGQTIIADTLANGSQMAKKLQYRVKIVTLDGEVIHSGGSMTGGATKQAKGQSLLSRSQELKTLVKQVARLKDELLADKQSLTQYGEQLQQLKEQLQLVQQKGIQARVDEKEAQSQYEQLKVVYTDMQKRVQLNAENLQKLTMTLDVLRRNVSELEQQEKVVSKQSQKARMHIETLSASTQERGVKLQELLPKLQASQTQLAVGQEQVVTLEKQVQQLISTIADETKRLAFLSTQKEDHLQTKEELTQALEEVSQRVEQLQTQKQETESVLAQLKQEKTQTDDELSLVETAYQDLQQQVQKLLRDSAGLEAKITRFDVSIETHLTRLNEEYQLTYEAANQLEALSMPISEASQLVSRLKREIEQLGPVNLTAVEEYDAVLQRHTFMSEQQLDLQQAKEQLLATMLEMDEEMSRRFSDTFYAIKKQFEKTFPKLFGGGKATLELTQPDNLLETGIDIVAQPPGKRLQNLSLLSGGEKAFTAIALLFAILEVKPVPFCLLDEVEAALDEANVGRYGRYLKEFVDQTQFIVITHRKGTMEEADVLYGVTMQESGVSKLASVSFEDYVEE